MTLSGSSQQLILCLNSGSSSLKFALYRMGAAEEELVVRGAVEKIGIKPGGSRIGSSDAHFWIKDANGLPLTDKLSHAHQISGDNLNQFQSDKGHKGAVLATLNTLRQLNFERPAAVGHRVVHGGPDFTAPCQVDGHLVDRLKELTAFAPLHLPAAIEGIEAIADVFNDLPQVACFDTAFHRSMPEVAQLFAIPSRFWQAGIRRYGFHGLSYEYILAAIGPSTYERLIIAHLGNGSSMSAVLNGRPMDTTMGFTPAGGLVMGTRSGDLDPGLVVHILKAEKLTPEQLDELVNEQSGLLGVSGLSPDMKTLLDARSKNERAALAVELFCYQASKYIGALSATLGGLDALIFTGGIGERAAAIREQICARLEYLAIRLDLNKNSIHADAIMTNESGCAVRVIPTNEDLMIARHTFRVACGSL